MSSGRIDITNNHTERPLLHITDWNELVRYAQHLRGKTNKKLKICLINEEQEVQINNKHEFDTNVKYAIDHGLKSLVLVVYIGDKREFNGIYYISNTDDKSTNSKGKMFPVHKLKSLKENVLANKWYIPVKSEEALGVCLTAAIKLSQEGQLDNNDDCRDFITTIVPEAFQKLQITDAVFSWPRDIHYGIFDMIELLVDLVGTRLRYAPVPVTLLSTLAISFDTNTTFSQRHKDEQLPTRRYYQLDDEEFLRTDFTNQSGTFGWIRSFIQRFIAQYGLKTLRGQFEYINHSVPTISTTMEYIALLKLFSKCSQCIQARRFRSLFTRPIRQAINYLLQAKKNNRESNGPLDELNEVLIEVCFNYEMTDEINAILELEPILKNNETLPLPESVAPVIIPLEQMTTSQDDCKELIEEMNSLKMNNSDVQPKSSNIQCTLEQMSVPLISGNHSAECTTDGIISNSEKRSLRRKHRREQRHLAKKEKSRSHGDTVKTYDRSNPEEILRFFELMKVKVDALYDRLQVATCNGNLREVLKIEEKLKLLRPYSARFVADKTTPDGTIMKSGEVFRKSWILLNDGSMPWSNDNIQLLNLSDGIQIINQPIIPVTAPHDRAIITVDFKCAQEPGTYESKWILLFRHQTFGPMIWCSIEVASATPAVPINAIKEKFELVDIPLPACFDLSKPYQSTSGSSSLRSSFIMSRSKSIDTHSEQLIDILEDPSTHNEQSPSTLVPPSSISALPKANEESLIELTIPSPTVCVESPNPSQSHPPLDLDTVITHIRDVATPASSTAKAIINTLQATAETTEMARSQQQTLINTFNFDTDDLFEHIEYADSRDRITYLSNDPFELLEEMGFCDREKNQRLLSENGNDLNRVIELLAAGSN